MSVPRILQIVFAITLVEMLIAPLPHVKAAEPVKHWAYQSCNLIVQYCIVG